MDALARPVATCRSRVVIGWVAIASALSGPAIAHADTVQYSTPFSFTHTGLVTTGAVSAGGTFNNTVVTSPTAFTLQKFDPSLGRLTGVGVAVNTSTATFAVSPSGLLSLVSTASATRTLAYAITAGTTSANGSNVVSNSGLSLVTLLGLGSAEIGGAPLAATKTFSLASDLAQFSGSGTFSVGLTATNAFSVTAAASAFNGAGFNGTGTYAGSVTVTYTFTPQQTVAGFVYADADHSGQKDASEAGTGATLYVKLATYSSGTCQSPALLAVAANPSTGAYTLGLVDAGSYCLIVDTNNTVSDVVPGGPSGFVPTEASTGIRTLTVSTLPVTSQDFGFFAGSSLTGRVFDDDGSGAGTANDGAPNGGEAGLAGASVRATSGSTTIDSAVTDGSGRYTLYLPSTTSGSVAVTATVPSGHVATGGAAGTTGGSFSRATNTSTFPFANGNAYSGVNFGAVPVNTLATDAVQSATPGSTVSYAHTFVAGSAGQVTFSIASTAQPAGIGWTETLYLDANCNGVVDAGESLVTAPVAVTAGQRVCLVLREAVPAGAPLGAQNAAVLSATMTYANANPALSTAVSRTDTTILGNANVLTLTKLVRNVTKGTTFAASNNASPNDVLEYQLTAANPSSGSVTGVAVNDATPTYTTFVSAACPSTMPSSITACAVSAQPAVGASGSVQWTFTGSLSSGASLTTTFQVRVSP